MKKILSVFTLALAAGLLFVSCEKEPDTGSVVNESIYLTTGLPVSNEVYYSVTVDELTGKTESVGTDQISLKLCSGTEVRSVVSATLKADFSKLPSNATRMPEEGYSLVRATAEIAAGAKEAAETFLVTINAETMTDAGTYVLPLTIEATSDNTEVSATANTVIVRFIRNINKAEVPEGWSKISSDRFTVGSLENYAGFEYDGMTADFAFDGDRSTGWYAEAIQYEWNEENQNYDYTYSDYASSYGCFAEVVFPEPVSLKGVVVVADENSDYYNLRPHRLSIMFRYEGDEEYTWDKTYDSNSDEASYYGTFLGEGATTWPDYQPSPADFVIAEHAYTEYSIDLTEKTAGKKVAAMIICPACFISSQGSWGDDISDFYYSAYYDPYYGVYTNEIVLFE